MDSTSLRGGNTAACVPASSDTTAQASASPLIADYRPRRVFAWCDGRAVVAGRALADIRAVAARLPAGGACINVCDDRYLFTVALAAGALSRTLNLLPQSHSEAILGRLRLGYPGAAVIDDRDVAEWCAQAGPTIDSASPKVAADQPVAVVFTSGSTGTPNPHVKYWGSLTTGSALMRQRFFGDSGPVNVVATVPPQHMYGLETSVLPALHAGFAADAGRPFMPWDVAAALARVPEPRALVTTPVHLRACLDARVQMPSLRQIMSATAPLDADLAARAQAAWRAPVHEIYGSSETGSIASRRTVDETVWQLYQGVTLADRHGLHVQGGHLPAPVPISDELLPLDAQRFRLLGRAADMLKVGGKRISMADLTGQLLTIDGVEDGAVFMPPDAPQRQRPAALVVSTTLAARDIGARLARRVDPVFVPRPLLRVASLPRNRLGKLPRDALVTAWTRARAHRRGHALS